MSKRPEAALALLPGLVRRQREAVSRHASELHSAAANLAELQSASQEIARSADAVSGSAEHALDRAKNGESVTRTFVESLEALHTNAAQVHAAVAELASRIAGITTAVDLIDELADRTDLLALNAALEGSRAGEAGRGILVIAAEMRRLAERVSAGTTGIRESVQAVREATEDVLEASERNRDVAINGEELGLAASVSLGQVVRAVEETHAAARDIRVATHQQQQATAGALDTMVVLSAAGEALQQTADELAGFVPEDGKKTGTK